MSSAATQVSRRQKTVARAGFEPATPRFSVMVQADLNQPGNTDENRMNMRNRATPWQRVTELNQPELPELPADSGGIGRRTDLSSPKRLEELFL